MSRADLEYVRNWATSKLSACRDPADSPYLTLRESLDGLLAKTDAGGSPPLGRSMPLHPQAADRAR